MVMPIRGYPAGQSVVVEGQFSVVLTYFNRGHENGEPDGRAQFLFVNLTEDIREIGVTIAVTYNSDAFSNALSFRALMAPRSVEVKELRRDYYKDATFAWMFVFADGDFKNHAPDNFHHAFWVPPAVATEIGSVEIESEEYSPHKRRR